MTMPADIERAMEFTLSEFPIAHAFIDDILVLSKGTELEHIAIVEKVLHQLDRENTVFKLRNANSRKQSASGRVINLRPGASLRWSEEKL